ncbi:Integrin beta-PS [Portunus trituberculatus]|uniref:Integrin beta-PS n=1 Tax=Portunus trituberculatus TaxID=210409 RepID=A0A5B7D435_PORTR|nr:Integrin beta-PS [Portunus trituberculatus]
MDNFAVDWTMARVSVTSVYASQDGPDLAACVRTAVRNALTPSGRKCSGNGICECNQCKCYEGIEGRYSGKYCEDCPTCRGKCSLYKECVQCQAFLTGKYSFEQCVTQCTLFNVTVVSNLATEEGERLCTFFDENDCRFKFVYGNDNHNEPVVRAQSTLECPPSRVEPAKGGNKHLYVPKDKTAPGKETLHGVS